MNLPYGEISDLDSESVRRFYETNRDVGFLIPVVNGQIFLGQRGTPPKEGMYGAIGGKVDSYEGLVSPFSTLHFNIKLGGHTVISIADQFALETNRELPAEAVLREFCEEAFNAQVVYPGKEIERDPKRLLYPNDFSEGDIVDLYRLGSFDDRLTPDDPVLNHCWIYIAKVNRADFNLSPRELIDMKPLVDIDPRQIWPGTKIALTHLKWMFSKENGGGIFRQEEFPPPKYLGYLSEVEKSRMAMMHRYTQLGLEKQISEMKLEERIFTTMIGAIMHS